MKQGPSWPFVSNIRGYRDRWTINLKLRFILESVCWVLVSDVTLNFRPLTSDTVISPSVWQMWHTEWSSSTRSGEMKTKRGLTKIFYRLSCKLTLLSSIYAPLPSFSAILLLICWDPPINFLSWNINNTLLCRHCVLEFYHLMLKTRYE